MMSTPHETVPMSETPRFASTPRTATSLGETADVASPHQEINERRARVENSELLQHLRGL